MLTDIRSKATPQQPSEPLKALDFKPNGYDMDGNPIQHSLSGGPQQPSEEKSITQVVDENFWELVQPSEKKALIDGIREVNKMTQEIFDAASEKKALSLEDMKKIMWDLENKLGYQPAYETIAQAIHSALPTQKALSVDSIKALLTTIMKKELVDIGEHFCFVCGEPMSEEKRGLLINHIAQAIHSALPARKEVKIVVNPAHRKKPRS